MRKHLKLLTICCCMLIVASGSLMARSGITELPHRYQPASQDRQLVQVENPIDGRIWSAWSFRNGAEFDIALAVKDENGIWSEPMFLGRDDGLDQVDPAFVIHESGAVVVAFAETSTGRILISALALEGRSWSRPLPVVSGDDLRSPSMVIVGSRLVLAFRSGERVEMTTIPLFSGPALSRPRGLNDGPDPIGANDGGKPDGTGTPDNDDESGDGKPSRTGMIPVIDDDR
jgi:hypothetical protein